MTTIHSSGSFDSAWYKWARAVEHAQTLDADIKIATSGPNLDPPVRLALGEYDNKRHGFPILVRAIAPIPLVWNLTLGDFAHNLRCSLDHIAWTLVNLGTEASSLTNWEPKDVYFPIAKGRNHFTKIAPRKLPGVQPAELAIICRYQPYSKGKTRVQWHWMRVLDDLVNDDKHRTIQNIWWRPVAGHYEVTQSEACRVDRIKMWTNRLAQLDAELAFVYVRKTDDREPNVQVQYGFSSYQPAFHERLRLDEWCQIAAITAMGLLKEFADPPDAIFTAIDLDWFERAIATWEGAVALWNDAGSGTPSRG